MRGQPWIVFVARRWFSARRETGGSASSFLAASGIAIGVAALIVVLGVMNGFQLGFIDSILEIGSFHVRIDDDRSGGPDEVLLSRIAADPAVESVLPFAETRCLLSFDGGLPRPMTLRAIPPDAGQRDPALLRALGQSAAAFPVKGLLMGAELARYLNIAVGDEIDILVVSSGGEDGVDVKTTRLRVGGTFKSGYLDYDFGMAFLTFGEAAPFFPPQHEVRYVYGLKLKDRFGDASFASRLASDYGIRARRIESWRQYNRSFFGALQMEKSVMMLLIGLIFLVVGVNIHHSMRRAVAERMEEIAVMRAVGASPESLRRTFVLEGIVLGAGGALLGLILGLFIAVNINEVFSIAESLVNGIAGIVNRIAGSVSGGSFRIFSPSYFYLMEVPVRILFPETLFIACASVISAVAAAASATAEVSRLAPAEVLRYE